MCVVSHLKSVFFLLFFSLPFFSCMHTPREKSDYPPETMAFLIRDDSLVYVSLKPMEILPLLKQTPLSSSLVSCTRLKNLYLDYSAQSLRVKGLARIPQQWLNACLWQKSKWLENHSTLRESHYRFKSKDLYLSIPNKREFYLYTRNFYTPSAEQELCKNIKHETLQLLEKSEESPFFLKIFNLADLLRSLEIGVPPILRLPFDEMSLTLKLKESQAYLHFTFLCWLDNKPPVLGVRFLLNCLFSNFPPTPLSEAWKRVPIAASPLHKNAVEVNLTLSQKELGQSLGVYASLLPIYKTKKAKEK